MLCRRRTSGTFIRGGARGLQDAAGRRTCSHPRSGGRRRRRPDPGSADLAATGYRGRLHRPICTGAVVRNTSSFDSSL